MRAAIFQAKRSDWSDASTIATTLELGTPLQIVTADFSLDKTRLAEVMEKIKDNELSLSDEVSAELSAYQDGSSKALSDKAKLFLTLSYGASRERTGFLIDGTLLRDLDRLDLRSIFGAAGDMPIIVVYRAAPRRLVLPPRFQLLSRSPAGFSLICHAHEFIEKRDEIVEMMSAMPVAAEGTDPEADSDSESIV